MATQPGAAIAASFEELEPGATQQNGAGSAETTNGKTDPNAGANAGAGSGSGSAADAKAGEDTAKGADKGSETTKFANEEAAQVLERLESLGITPDQAEAIATKAGAFDSVVEMLTSDPGAFFNQMRLNNPKMFWNVLEKATDIYLELKPPSGRQGGGKSGADAGSTGNQQDNPVMEAIADLRRRLDEREERDQATAAQQRVGEIKRQYNEKLDGFLSKVPNLSARDRKAVKAMINDSVSQDQKAITEINRGQFVSLARHVQQILNDWTAETKKAASEEQQMREQVAQAGTKSAPNAAEQAGGQQAGRKDDWDDVGTAFARDLMKSKK